VHMRQISITRVQRQCRFGAVPSIPARGARISSISRRQTGPTRRICTPHENWRGRAHGLPPVVRPRPVSRILVRRVYATDLTRQGGAQVDSSSISSIPTRPTRISCKSGHPAGPTRRLYSSGEYLEPGGRSVATRPPGSPGIHLRSLSRGNARNGPRTAREEGGTSRRRSRRRRTALRPLRDGCR
jgi:hypothetical protein